MVVLTQPGKNPLERSLSLQRMRRRQWRLRGPLTPEEKEDTTMVKKAAVDHAVATIKKATNTDALKVSVTNTLSQAMPQSPSWAAATDVQTAVKGWSAEAAAIGVNAALIASLRAQLSAAEAKQAGLRRSWLASKQQVVTTVTVFCGGSADLVKSFNLDVITHARLGALPPPANLAVNPGTAPGDVVGTWTKGIAVHGFVVQHATDPTNAATTSAPTPSTKPRFTLSGLPTGATVSLRVAAIDPASPTGMSPWSAWVVGNAR
jgi:hypothetical protein